MDSELALTKDPTALCHLLGKMLSAEGERQLPRVGRRSVESSRKKRVKLKPKDAATEAILSGLLTYVVALSSPPHVQASLLEILADVDNVVRGERGYVQCVCVTVVQEGLGKQARYVYMYERQPCCLLYPTLQMKVAATQPLLKYLLDKCSEPTVDKGTPLTYPPHKPLHSLPSYTTYIPHHSLLSYTTYICGIQVTALCPVTR